MTSTIISLPFVTVVSGLPRSGTSMMMKMLEAGGLPICQDGMRLADTDNPKGYYEFERVKNLAKDACWLGEASGKAIKIISSLLPYMPPELDYKVIFMRRKMPEILASQQKMLARVGNFHGVTDEVMAAKFSIHLRKIAKILEQGGREVLMVDYSEVIADPSTEATRVDAFLGGGLNQLKMCQVVDRALYRQRH